MEQADDKAAASPSASATPLAANARPDEPVDATNAHPQGPPAADTSAATAGSAQPAPRIYPPGDRIYAKARFVWIQPAAQPSKGWLGYLTLGQSVRLFEGSAEKAKRYGPGCDAWYRVEPDGYVCLGKETTLDPNDVEFTALRKYAADVSSPYPYRYAESLGAARYNSIPNEKEQRKAEWDLDRHRERLEEAKGNYAQVDRSAAGVAAPTLLPFSALVREPRNYIAPGSTIAYSAQFDAGGRTFLYTADHALVPKDRVLPYPERSFQGVMLQGDEILPLAFFRKQDRPQYEFLADAFVANGKSFARLSHVGLTGEKKRANGEVFLETKQPGVWVAEKDAVVAELRTTIPYRDDELPEGRRSWLDISILGGTLVAYEDRKPVFATMISAGRGGLPVPGRPLISTASTPTGTFRVDGKFLAASMVSSTDASVVHAEVQYVQNFHGAHALHGAYWHDSWGELKSGGCVNLSPRDSQWLFGFTDPKMPTDWHGVRSTRELGPPTRVVVRP